MIESITTDRKNQKLESEVCLLKESFCRVSKRLVLLENFLKYKFDGEFPPESCFDFVNGKTNASENVKSPTPSLTRFKIKIASLRSTKVKGQRKSERSLRQISNKNVSIKNGLSVDSGGHLIGYENNDTHGQGGPALNFNDEIELNEAVPSLIDSDALIQNRMCTDTTNDPIQADSSNSESEIPDLHELNDSNYEVEEDPLASGSDEDNDNRDFSLLHRENENSNDLDSKNPTQINVKSTLKEKSGKPSQHAANNQELQDIRKDITWIRDLLERSFQKGSPGNSTLEGQSISYELMRQPTHLGSINPSSGDVEFVTVGEGDEKYPFVLPPGLHSKISATDNMRTVIREILLFLHLPEELVNFTLTGESSKKRKKPDNHYSQSRKRSRVSQLDLREELETDTEDLDKTEENDDTEYTDTTTEPIPARTYGILKACVQKKFPLRIEATEKEIKLHKKSFRGAITNTLQYIKKSYRKVD